MNSRHIRLSIVAATVAALASMASMALAALAGSPMAHATEADEQFLSVVADLGLEFATPDDAMEAGDNVCDIVAEGSANNVGPAEIRVSIINSLHDEGLDDATATQLMWGAVNAYCPQYNAVVGD